MKKTFLVLFVALSAIFTSCSDDDNAEKKEYLVAVPLTSDLRVFKEEAVDVMEPEPIQQSGKIYAYQDYVFVNDLYRGIHVIDNSNPSSPQNIAFIKLEGNNDISIKNDRLYADSYGDLVIFDISDINDIPAAKRIENAIYQEFWCTVGFDVDWPEADYFDYSGFDAGNEAIIGWEVKRERLSQAEFESRFGYNDLALQDGIAFNESARGESTASDNSTGQGGSLARFKIVGNYLYAVEWSSISIFDITDLDNPVTLEDVYTNGAIETIYNQGEILFLGGPQGMYIYDISNPEKPVYVSDFQHGTACDPVVVDGDWAFVTLRGDTFCGNTESGLYIVDVSNLANPSLFRFYPLSGPYGLGFKEDLLFVCDGADGLKVFDKSDVGNIQLINHFKDIVTYDVIPLSQSLLMIGDGVLYQYAYSEGNIELLSEYSLN